MVAFRHQLMQLVNKIIASNTGVRVRVRVRV